MTTPSAAHDISPSELAELIQNCVRAKEKAYCPYSHFRVGATLLTDDGLYINGANVENASYSVGICAERTAYARAVADGHTKFRALAVSTDISPPASPCGMCRQFIREFGSPNFPVFMIDQDQNYHVMTLEQVGLGSSPLRKFVDLLPFSFGPDVLPPPDQMKAAQSDMGKKS
ncbi:MAG: hypothetical protein M1823_002679 [Watsoniomyces obsoletus]|nr:MAG: hypothetical protein M1823_002679 [Watsoniomyces obsoletus]